MAVIKPGHRTIQSGLNDVRRLSLVESEDKGRPPSVDGIGYCSHLWHNLQAGELEFHFASFSYSLPRENKRTKYGSLSYCVREISHCPVDGVRKLMSYSTTAYTVTNATLPSLAILRPGVQVVSGPDPSHGRREGLGTCLHSSCPHGMQLCVVISNQLRYHMYDHSRPARCSPRLLSDTRG